MYFIRFFYSAVCLFFIRRFIDPRIVQGTVERVNLFKWLKGRRHVLLAEEMPSVERRVTPTNQDYLNTRSQHYEPQLCTNNMAILSSMCDVFIRSCSGGCGEEGLGFSEQHRHLLDGGGAAPCWHRGLRGEILWEGTDTSLLPFWSLSNATVLQGLYITTSHRNDRLHFGSIWAWEF